MASIYFYIIDEVIQPLHRNLDDEIKCDYSSRSEVLLEQKIKILVGRPPQNKPVLASLNLPCERNSGSYGIVLGEEV